MGATERNPAARERLTRDQARALHAYRCVEGIQSTKQAEYKIAVNDLGATILRSGLAAAVAALERLGDKGKPVLQHLAEANIVGLEGTTADSLPCRVRKLETEDYMLATLEALQVAMWLKRAVQASFRET